MIFTVIILYPCLLLESVVNCASVEVAGSHHHPNHQLSSTISRYDHVDLKNRSSNLSSSRSSNSTNSNVAVNIKTNPLATSNYGSLEDRQRRLKPRQVSPSEWLFSTLIQPSVSPTQGVHKETEEGQNERETPLAYRSIASSLSPSNYYTNYYRNHNIYSHQQPTGRRVDGGEDKDRNHVVGKGKQGELVSSLSSSADAGPNPEEGFNRRRASLLPSTYQQHLYANGDDVHAASATSKMPEAISSPPIRYSETTGLSKTAPATDPTILGTERSTSTQEMQIEDGDIVDYGPRAEIGGGRGKQGRELLNGKGSETLYFQDNSDSAPIVFPGRATTYSSSSPNGKGHNRPRPPLSRSGTGGNNANYGGSGGSTGTGSKVNSFGNGEPWPAINLNPHDRRLIDGWHKINQLRHKSKSISDGHDGRKSSIVSDTSSDAKIISILNIQDSPRCAMKNGYCDEIDGYPRSFFNQVLNKTLNLTPAEFQSTFGETIDNNSVLTDVEYSLRDGFDETPLCSVREHTIYPKAAQNRQGKFMYIVNHDEYLQGIRVETCRTEKSSCMFTEGHLPGYTSTCKQKYIYKKLLAFSPDGKPMPDSFRLPSCCVCYVKSMFISDRINPAVDLGGANADIQPTISSAAEEDSWHPGPSSTIAYPSDPHNDDEMHHHDGLSPSLPSSTEPGSSLGSITFPSTSSDDGLSSSSYQVPSPTTSTSSSKIDGGGDSHLNNGGQLHNRAENQTASRRLYLK